MSLADAERLTNVRGKYLSALERGDFDALPGRTYARAFLRTYATALGLEADRFVAAFEEMVPEPEEDTIVVGTPARTRAIRPSYLGALVAVAVVVGVAAWGASSHHSKSLVAPVTAARAAPQPVAERKRTVTHPKPAPVRPAALVVKATRGDCWLLVRKGGPVGAVVFEGVVHGGSTMRFASPSLWMRLGAPWNVDVMRGTKRVGGLSGTQPVDVVA